MFDGLSVGVFGSRGTVLFWASITGAIILGHRLLALGHRGMATDPVHDLGP